MCHPPQTSATSLVKTASAINAACVLAVQKIPLPGNRAFFQKQRLTESHRSSNLGHRRHCSVVLWSILEVCLVGRWEVHCVSVFLLLGQDCWLEEWDRAVRWGVWLCPSVHSAGSCAFFSLQCQ